MEITKKHVIIGSAILAAVVIIIAIAMVMTKENMTGATGSTGGAAGNLLAVDATGNLSVTNIETQLADSGATTGMTRFIDNMTAPIAASTSFAVGKALITMNLSNLTPGNKLIVNANCPVYCNPGYNFVQLTAQVGTSVGTSMTLQFYTWVWSGIYGFTPTAEFIITSDPTAGPSQTLTISVNSLGAPTGVAVSPPQPVTYTCSVHEVS